MNLTSAGIVSIARWLLATALLLPLATHAIEVTDRLSLRGFYTLDVTYSDSDGASILTLSDPITLDEGETSSDASVIGLQADYALTDTLDFTLQAISSRQTDSSYAPDIEWAYLNYDFGNDLRLRAGKMKLSLLQGTELRYVGFSRLWVRPLVPTSGAGGFDDYSGVEFIKGAAYGDYNLSVQGSYGKAEHAHDFIDNRDVKLAAFKVGKESSWLNLALLQARYDVSTPSGIALKNDAVLNMGSIETELQWGNAIINGGYAYGAAEINPDEQLAYLSLGYRFSRITPYVLHSQRRMIFDASEVRSLLPPPPPPPPPPAPPPPPPRPTRDGVQATDTIAIGLRYDVTPTFAIKGQWDHWREKDQSKPLAGTVEQDGNLFTIVFEGVF